MGIVRNARRDFFLMKCYNVNNAIQTVRNAKEEAFDNAQNANKFYQNQYKLTSLLENA